ncbi:MAG: DedA family protein [Acidimicrobiales bacterium]
MAAIASIATWIEHFRGPVVYIVCGALVFGEAGVLLGFVIPGETAALAGGALAGLHPPHANVAAMVAVVIGCAIAGDSTGYEVGKIIGPWLLERRPLRTNLGVHKAQELIARYGGPAVFLGRWVALARAMIPGLSGMSGMRYRTFLTYNAIGGTVWGTTFVMLGYAAGKSFESVARRVGLYSLVVVGAVVLVIAAWVIRRKVRERRERRRLIESGELGRRIVTGAGDARSTESAGDGNGAINS